MSSNDNCGSSTCNVIQTTDNTFTFPSSDTNETENAALEETQTLKLLEEFRKLYEKRLQRIDLEACQCSDSGEYNKLKITVLEDWVHDLTEQNIALVEALEQLEHEAADRVEMLELKLKQSSYSTGETMLRLKEYEAELQDSVDLRCKCSMLEESVEHFRNYINSLKSDLCNLAKLARHAKSTSDWKSDGVVFQNFNYDDIFQNHAFFKMHSSNECLPASEIKVQHESDERGTHVNNLGIREALPPFELRSIDSYHSALELRASRERSDLTLICQDLRSSFQEDMVIKDRAIADLEAQVTDLNLQLDTKESKLNELWLQVNDLKDSLKTKDEEFQNYIDSMKKENARLKEEIETLNVKLKERSCEVNTLRHNLTNAEKEFENDVGKRRISKILAEHEGVKQKLENREHEIRENIAAINKLQDEVDKLSKQLEERSKRDAAKAKSRDDVVTSLDHTLASYKKDKEVLDQKFLRLEEQLIEKDNEIIHLSETIARTEDQLRLREKDIASLTEAVRNAKECMSMKERVISDLSEAVELAKAETNLLKNEMSQVVKEDMNDKEEKIKVLKLSLNRAQEESSQMEKVAGDVLADREREISILKALLDASQKESNAVKETLEKKIAELKVKEDSLLELHDSLHVVHSENEDLKVKFNEVDLRNELLKKNHENNALRLSLKQCKSQIDEIKHAADIERTDKNVSLNQALVEALQKFQAVENSITIRKMERKSEVVFAKKEEEIASLLDLLKAIQKENEMIMKNLAINADKEIAKKEAVILQKDQQIKSLKAALYKIRKDFDAINCNKKQMNSLLSNKIFTKLEDENEDLKEQIDQMKQAMTLRAQTGDSLENDQMVMRLQQSFGVLQKENDVLKSKIKSLETEVRSGGTGASLQEELEVEELKARIQELVRECEHQKNIVSECKKKTDEERDKLKCLCQTNEKEIKRLTMMEKEKSTELEEAQLQIAEKEREITRLIVEKRNLEELHTSCERMKSELEDHNKEEGGNVQVIDQCECGSVENDYRDYIQSLEEEVSIKDKEIQTLQGKFELLKQELDKKENQISNLVESSRSHERSIQELKIKLAEKDRDLDKTCSKMLDLEINLAKEKELLKHDYKEKHRIVVNNLHASEMKTAKAAGEVEACKSTVSILQDELDALRRNFDAQAEQLAEREAENEILKNKCCMMKFDSEKEVKKYQSIIEELRNRIKSKENIIQQLKEELNAVQSRLKETSENLESKESMLRQKQTEIIQLEKNIMKTNVEIEDLKSNLDSANKETLAIRTQCEELTKSLDKYSESNITLERKNNQLEDTCKKLKFELVSIQKSFRALQTEYFSKAESISSLEIDLEEMAFNQNEMCNESQNIIQNVRLMLRHCHDKHTELLEVLESKDDDIRKLKSQLGKMMQKVKHLNKENGKLKNQLEDCQPHLAESGDVDVNNYPIHTNSKHRSSSRTSSAAEKSHPADEFQREVWSRSTLRMEMRTDDYESSQMSLSKRTADHNHELDVHRLADDLSEKNKHLKDRFKLASKIYARRKVKPTDEEKDTGYLSSSSK